MASLDSFLTCGVCGVDDTQRAIENENSVLVSLGLNQCGKACQRGRCQGLAAGVSMPRAARWQEEWSLCPWTCKPARRSL